MSDDLVKRLRDHIAVVIDNRGHVFEAETLCDEAADRIAELEAKLAKAVEAKIKETTMSEFPVVIPTRCVNEEERGKYGLRRPKEIWRVRISFSPNCRGFMSRQKYSSLSAAEKASKRVLAELKGQEDG